MSNDKAGAVSSEAFRLEAAVNERGVWIRLTDLAAGYVRAEGPYRYRAATDRGDGARLTDGIRGAAVRVDGDTVEVTGVLAGLGLVHTFRLAAGSPVLEERLVLRNAGQAAASLAGLETGMTLRITDHVGAVLPLRAADRLVAVPFQHRPTDPAGFDQDFSLADLLRLSGREHRVNLEPLTWPQYGHVPCRHWASEGWAWTHEGRSLGVFKLNQDGMEFSLIAAEAEGEGFVLRFGGAGMHAGDPSTLAAIEPGQSVALGLTRYEIVDGGPARVFHAFRRFLDGHGCRFPADYDPPVHWNELYDNPEWNLGSPGHPPNSPPGGSRTRPITYTRALMEQEAEKARRYGCQSLYLDPGWDTDFGTLRWGKEWLGPRREFIEAVRQRYGLGVSLHCPLATWMSIDGRGVGSWPRESLRRRSDGTVLEGAVCPGSRQYIEEAEQRLLDHCADGVVFLMFDGTWWNGGCWDRGHGHPVPLTMEDHVRAHVDLARRIHARYPRVLIEMHDMITGGTIQRYTPVYYKHGLPGSYDENWGFELMWQPMEDILAGRARSLYWYNLGCNVPLYLHIDLRDDNEHCLVLWWYASTCRHLGIGGTHPVAGIAEAQVRAMKRYRALDRFYKRGEFFGMHEEAHVHALASENAFVVNLFNLSAEGKVVEGEVNVAEMGLDPHLWYVTPKGGRFDARTGCFHVARRMPPWSAEVMEVRSIAPR